MAFRNVHRPLPITNVQHFRFGVGTSFPALSENETGGAAGFNDLAARCKHACFPIDPKEDDCVAILIRHIEMASATIETKKARIHTPDRFPTEGIEHSVS